MDRLIMNSWGRARIVARLASTHIVAVAEHRCLCASISLRLEGISLPPAERGVEFIVITSKLTSKAQTTIPQPVRAALNLREGDELLYEIVDQRVVLTKARRGRQVDDPFRTFREWSSEADAKAYGSL